MRPSKLNSNLLRIPYREIKVWARILMFTLIFNSSFPAFASNVLFANSDQVALCTTGGYKSVSVLRYDVTESSGSHCVFCLNTDDVDELISQTDFDAGSVFNSGGGMSLRDTPLITPKFLFPILRAPPAFS
jgi:hypothetical protein